MSKTNINHKKGFTIIEVVLVLAIAGLIFLMVFIAFPALQRSQHDTQRTDDMARVQSQLMSWQNNHNNKLPAAGTCLLDDSQIVESGETYTVNGNSSKACEFVKEYLNAADATDDTFIDPSGTAYSIVITENISSNINKANQGDSKTSVETNGGKKSAIDVDITKNVISISDDTAQDAYTMWIIPGGTCQEDTVVPSSKNDYAILMRLEGSGIKCTGAGH